MDKILTWFKTDEARLRIPVYIAWNYLVFLVLCITNINKMIIALLPIFSSALVYSIYSASGPFTEYARGVYKKFPYSSFLIITVPCLLLAWPAEKISYRLNKNFSFYGKGMKFYHLSRIHEGINQLEKVKASKYDARGATACWTALADLYFEDEQYTQAIKTYSKALNNDPSLITYTKLGRCYFIINDYKSAADFFMEVISKSDEKLDCEVLTARYRNKMDDYEGALAKLKASCLDWKKNSWKDNKDKNSNAKVFQLPPETAPLVWPKSSRLEVISLKTLVVIITIFTGLSYYHNKSGSTKPDTSTTGKTDIRLPSKTSPAITTHKKQPRLKLIKKRSTYYARKQKQSDKKVYRKTLLQQIHPIYTIKFE